LLSYDPNGLNLRLEQHNGIWVLRDDLLTGGTKSRFIEQLIPDGVSELVYASPVYGGFQIALAAVCAKLGLKATIFCAYRNTPHPNTLKAKSFGATIYQVKHGYLSNVEAKANDYCLQTGAYKLKFGANYPTAISAISNAMAHVSMALAGEPAQVWCALGSGTLTRGIIAGTSKAQVHAVVVGKGTNLKHSRLTLHQYPRPFDKPAKIKPPFPSTANYDAKAWEVMHSFTPVGKVLFWNVL